MDKSLFRKQEVLLWTKNVLTRQLYCHRPKFLQQQIYCKLDCPHGIRLFFLQVAAVHKITTECWHLYSISGQTFEIPADYLEEMSCCLYLVLKPIADQPLCSDSCHRFLLIHSVEISSFYMCINKKAYSFANKMLLS